MRPERDMKEHDTREPAASDKRPVNAVTVTGYLVCAAVFVGLIIHGRLVKATPPTPAPPTETVTVTSASSATTTASSSSRQTTSSTAAAVKKSRAVPAVLTVTEKTASASRTTKKTTASRTSASVRTLVLTTSPVTTATALPETEPVSAFTETEPPTVTTSVSSSTTTTVTTTRKTTTTRYGFPADINKITYEGLIQIPGIGEKTAREILAFREERGVISNMKLLLDIYGIGEATLDSFSTYLYVSGADFVELTTTETTVPAAADPDVTAPRQRQSVHINSADEYELAEKLLLSAEKAEAIVRVRGKIGFFGAIEELLLVDELSDSDIRNIKDYIIIDRTETP